MCTYAHVEKIIEILKFKNIETRNLNNEVDSIKISHVCFEKFIAILKISIF